MLSGELGGPPCSPGSWEDYHALPSVILQTNLRMYCTAFIKVLGSRARIGCIRQYKIYRGLIRKHSSKTNLFQNVLLFNYYIMNHLANCTPSGDTSIFRFELDCPSYVPKNPYRCIHSCSESLDFLCGDSV